MLRDRSGEQTRHLQFPEQESVGWVQWGRGDNDDNPAQGSVAVPKDARVSLTVHSSADLVYLDALPTDALFRLLLRGRHAHDWPWRTIGDDLRHLRHLTSLRYLTIYFSTIEDAALPHLAALTWLEGLDLMGLPELGDSALAILTNLTQLEMLSLTDLPITGLGLAHFINVQFLGLSKTRIGDTGLTEIACLARLERLDLSRTAVTDTGLTHLTGLTQLKELDLRGTAVTLTGKARLQHVLPDCRIQ
ncbi:MAG: leucine-rich repeat domain-containing protein [Thermomicrobiales bacterium]